LALIMDTDLILLCLVVHLLDGNSIFSLEKLFSIIQLCITILRKGIIVRTKYLLIVAILILLVSFANAQSVRIAYVNSDEILQKLPEYNKIKKEIEATIKEWQDELEKMTNEFQAAYDDYQKKEALLDPKVKAEKQKNLQDLQQKIRDYQFQKFDQRDGEIVTLREKKFGPIREKVLQVIAKIAKEGNYNFIFDKLENATNILYADEKLDLTYKVIDELKRGAESGSK